MDKTLTMARSADSSSGAGARALARRPSNRRQNTSFFSVSVVFGPNDTGVVGEGKGSRPNDTAVSIRREKGLSTK